MKLHLPVALLACIASLAHGQDVSPLTGKDVTLRSKPNLSRYYPNGAAMAHKQGAASVICVIGDKGDLSGCSIQSKAPPGDGFAAAGMKPATHPRIPDTP